MAPATDTQRDTSTLIGRMLPNVVLPATDGAMVDLAKLDAQMSSIAIHAPARRTAHLFRGGMPFPVRVAAQHNAAPTVICTVNSDKLA